MASLLPFSAGAASAQNAKYRENMEDTHSVVENFQNNPNQGFFAVYDGHAGSHTANWCQKYFHQEFFNILNKFNPLWPIPSILAETFITGDKRLILQQDYDHSGSTASVVFIKYETKDNNSRFLYTANVGDSRIVLSTNGCAKVLTRDHNLEDKRENDRVKANGGFVARNRVDGMLAITRAIGDSGFKPYVSSSPFTTETKLDQYQDEYVIIATDGLWDVCDSQTAVDLIQDINNPNEAAQFLVDYALEHGSYDNITVVVVRLRDTVNLANIKTNDLGTVTPETNDLKSPIIHPTSPPSRSNKTTQSPPSSKAIPLLRNIIANDAINANITQQKTSTLKTNISNNKTSSTANNINNDDSVLSPKLTVGADRTKYHDSLYDSRHPTIPIPVLDARDRRNSLFEEKISSLTANVLDLGKYKMPMGSYSEPIEHDHTTRKTIDTPVIPDIPIKSTTGLKINEGFDFGANLPLSPPAEVYEISQNGYPINREPHYYRSQGHHNQLSPPKENTAELESVSSSADMDYQNLFFNETKKQILNFGLHNDAFIDNGILVRVDDKTSYGSMSPMLLDHTNYHPNIDEYLLNTHGSVNLFARPYNEATSPDSPQLHQSLRNYNKKTNRLNGHGKDYNQEHYRSGFSRKEIPLIFDHPPEVYHKRGHCKVRNASFGRSPLSPSGFYGKRNFNIRVESALLSDDE